jgi:hypothetical protein
MIAPGETLSFAGEIGPGAPDTSWDAIVGAYIVADEPASEQPAKLFAWERIW